MDLDLDAFLDQERNSVVNSRRAIEEAYKPTNVAFVGCGVPLRSVDEEWQMYMDRCQSDQAVVPVDASNNCFGAVFAWWRVNGNRFPTLYRMYLDVAKYPGTAVESERAFSGAGRLLSAVRNRMSSDSAQALLTQSSWLELALTPDMPLALMRQLHVKNK